MTTKSQKQSDSNDESSESIAELLTDAILSATRSENINHDFDEEAVAVVNIEKMKHIQSYTQQRGNIAMDVHNNGNLVRITSNNEFLSKNIAHEKAVAIERRIKRRNRFKNRC